MNDIIHPTNRVWPNGLVIPTPEEGYDEGFDRGLNWPDKWESHGEPGGPFRGCSRFEALRKANLAYCDAWLRGWREGHEKKLALQANGSVILPNWVRCFS